MILFKSPLIFHFIFLVQKILFLKTLAIIQLKFLTILT